MIPQRQRPVASWVPRVLVSAAEGGRSGLLEELRQQGLAVLMAPVDGLLRELDRGDVDVVLLSTEPKLALHQLRALREVSSVPAVVILRQERVTAQPFFDAGADDCVFAGSNHTELGVRLRAVLRRRSQLEPAAVVRSERFVVDVARHVFTLDGRPVHLPPKEFGLLVLLMRRDGHVVSRDDALELVWGPGHGGDPTTVDVHMKRLRAKIEIDPAKPAHLLTVRGLGYRFQA